jgi:hypothetical protein
MSQSAPFARGVRPATAWNPVGRIASADGLRYKLLGLGGTAIYVARAEFAISACPSLLTFADVPVTRRPADVAK